MGWPRMPSFLVGFRRVLGLGLYPCPDVGLPGRTYAEVLRELAGGRQLEGLPGLLTADEPHLDEPVDIIVGARSAGLQERGLEDGLVVRYGGEGPHDACGHLRLCERPCEVGELRTQHHPEPVAKIDYRRRTSRTCL